jgi:hypothetical protein
LGGTYSVKQPTPYELQVELFGEFDAKTAADLHRDVRSAAEKLAPRTFSVIFNLVGLTDCSMEARPALVEIQRTLALRASRTAYLDDRPRFRGLALWVMHLAEDPNAKAVATPEQARQWIEATYDRSSNAMARAVSP